MEIVKFKTEIQTLKRFFELHCINNHDKQKKILLDLNYKNDSIKIELFLCQKCLETITYSFERLQECPHEIKPKCRTCPNPCYEKKQWKEVAKVMRYSGLRLGLISVKNKIKKLLNK